MSTDPQFEKKGASYRAEKVRQFEKGKRVHGGTLDFSSYAQAHDRRYLGFQGDMYLGRPTGNDSSNVTAILNSPSYWRRYYYKGEAMKETMSEVDAVVEAKYGKKPAPSDLNGLFKLADSLREDVLLREKPDEIKDAATLNFHNVLGKKYTQGLGFDYKYCKNAHYSSKHERDFVLANYYRSDAGIQLRREEVIKRQNSLRTNFPEEFDK